MGNSRRTSAQQHKSPESHPEMEKCILRGLCGGPISRASWERLVAELKEYGWREPEHKVVFDALTRIRSHNLKALRAQLPAQTTRMGFPDVDWTIYLNGAETSAPEIERLVRKLKAGTKDVS